MTQMTANKKAVQVRIDMGTASQAGHQRAHDLRIGPQPDYVDTARTALNRVLAEPLTGPELRATCETRRGQRQTQRAMKSNAAICVSGIITFGHEAQPIFAALSPDRQDAAYRELAEAIAARLGTTVSGLVVHRDEAADHAHFQCPGFTRDGMPVSKIAKREALRDLQTIAAEIMGRHAPGIERGTSRWQRIAAGENYADTVYKSSADMRSRLPAEIAAKEAELVAVQEKLDKNAALLAKAQATAEAEGKRAEKARRNAVTYERRMEAARSELAGIEADLKRLRGLQDGLLAENRKLAEDGERIAQENGQKAAEARRLDEVLAQKKTQIASLRARLQSLNAA